MTRNEFITCLDIIGACSPAMEWIDQWKGCTPRQIWEDLLPIEWVEWLIETLLEIEDTCGADRTSLPSYEEFLEWNIDLYDKHREALVDEYPWEMIEEMLLETVCITCYEWSKSK